MPPLPRFILRIFRPQNPMPDAAGPAADFHAAPAEIFPGHPALGTAASSSPPKRRVAVRNSGGNVYGSQTNYSLLPLPVALRAFRNGTRG